MIGRDGRGRHPERREHAGEERHQHARDAERLGKLAGVQRPGATEGDQREPPRVVAALHRDHPQRSLHARVGDTHDARGGLPQVAAKCPGDRPQRSLRGANRECHAPAEKSVRAQTAQDKVRVRDGRLGGVAVAGRPGVRARALRPDAERAAGVDARDRTSPGADRVHVDRGDAQRHAVDHRFRRERDRAVAQTHVGRRAAHIERDDAVEARAGRDLKRAGHAPGRARQHGPHSQRRRSSGPRAAPVRLHHAQLARLTQLQAHAELR